MTESLAIMGDVTTKMQEEMAATAKQMSGESTFAAKDRYQHSVVIFFILSVLLEESRLPAGRINDV